MAQLFQSFLRVSEDPKTLLADAPCICCLTPQQLLAVKVKLMCDIVEDAAGSTCDIDTVQASAACYACYSQAQLDQIELAILCSLAVAVGGRTDCDAAVLVDEAKCLKCLPEHQLRAMYVYLFHQWVTGLLPT